MAALELRDLGSRLDLLLHLLVLNSSAMQLCILTAFVFSPQHVYRLLLAAAPALVKEEKASIRSPLAVLPA